MPEIPKLFDLKEKQQRRKLLQRNNSRVLRSHELDSESAMGRTKIKTKANKKSKKSENHSKNVNTEEERLLQITPPVQKKGRQTNNSLASAVGQIVIETTDAKVDLEYKKGVARASGSYNSSGYGYGYNHIQFGIEEEERRVGMHKVLESVKDHDDAWPFLDPVDEEYAPRFLSAFLSTFNNFHLSLFMIFHFLFRYYSVVRKPMDLSKMEEKLENGSYKRLSQFKKDFHLIVDNCKQYNGSENGRSYFFKLISRIQLLNFIT